MVREGLLARLTDDGQQASIHIDIDADAGKVGFQQKQMHFQSFREKISAVLLFYFD